MRRILPIPLLKQVFVILAIFLLMSVTGSFADEITQEEIRDYVRYTYDLVDGSNELLDQALLHNPIGAGTSSFLDVFKVMMTADKMRQSINTNNWQKAVETGLQYALD